ncbi:MAG: DUF2975 domain-containing protein [Mucilaginibacter sp.]
MKTLGKKSLSAVITGIINVVWWLEWVACFVFIVMLLLVAYFRRGYSLGIPITFSDRTIMAPVISLDKSLPNGIVNTTSGVFSLHVMATWQNVSLMILATLLIFAVVSIITYQLKAIFSNLSKNQPFNELTIVRIRNIAFILMAYSVLQWLGNIYITQMFIRNFNWRYTELTYSFNFSCLFMGIILIVVAEIFKIGASLEEEQKLTI